MHTVPLPTGVCTIWWADAVEPRDDLLDLLDDRERAKWARLHRPQDRALYLTAHALARLVLAEPVGVAPAAIKFCVTCPRCGADHGKPRVDTSVPVELSISHSGRRTVVAVALGVPVGVDVETVALRGPEVPRIALSPTELAVLDQLPEAARTPAFMRYWTRKEALLKATGDGLMVDLARITVSGPDSPPVLLAWPDDPPLPARLHLVDLDPGPGYAACLASLGTPLRVVEHDGAPLLA
jgi:4'-phosphopantetheinyl transferase